MEARHATSRTERERRFSARLAALPLGFLAVAAASGASLAMGGLVDDPVAPEALVGAYGVLFLLSLLAAGLEWTRNPIGERFALAAGGLGTVLTWSSLTNGWWYLAPVLGLATLVTLITVAYRFMVRDEAKHGSPESRHREY